MKTMQYFKYLTLGVAALISAAACQKVDTSGAEKATHVSLSPAPTEFAAEGTGENNYIAVVTVLQGVTPAVMDWTVESTADYVEVTKTEVYSQHKETWSGAIHDIVEPGIELSVAANNGYKRTFDLVFTVADGTVETITCSQLGDLADAEVTTDVKNVEFVAVGGTENVTFVTNMDTAEFSFTYPEGGSADWLTAELVEPGKVAVTATKWTDKDNTRSATMTITVGTPETSVASIDIPVLQLQLQEQSFIYGTAVDNLPIERSLQMNKVSDGVFSITTFFTEGSQVLFNKDSRVLSYPFYALEDGGKIAVIESGDASAVKGPQVTANGLMVLHVDYNTLTWNWERVTNKFAMPDDQIKNYKTKAYIARDGSMKTWMVEHMRWDGGDINPKLGSGMVKDKNNGAAGSGGYAAADFPSAWNDWTKLNPAFETIENEGKGQLETYSDDGRIYTYHEMVGAEARHGIGYARYEEAPQGWREGDKITDARGITYTVKKHKIGTGAFTGDNAADEAANPMLKIQAQGICPYGWHIANAADWLDLCYAMSQASAGHTHPVSAADCTYKQFTEGGVPNMACWLRNTKQYQSGADLISDGADDFGFEFYPLGYRYMTQGFQNWSERVQVWIPYPTEGSKYDYTYSTCRLNVIINTNHASPGTTNNFTNFDIGQAVAPFRCVKNY